MSDNPLQISYKEAEDGIVLKAYPQPKKKGIHRFNPWLNPHNFVDARALGELAATSLELAPPTSNAGRCYASAPEELDYREIVKNRLEKGFSPVINMNEIRGRRCYTVVRRRGGKNGSEPNPHEYVLDADLLRSERDDITPEELIDITNRDNRLGGIYLQEELEKEGLEGKVGIQQPDYVQFSSGRKWAGNTK